MAFDVAEATADAVGALERGGGLRAGAGRAPGQGGAGLNYESLRKRVDEAASRGRGALPGSDDFVELTGAQLLGLPAAAGPVVEFSDASGGRLTVRLAAGSALDVTQLVAAFRGRQP